MITPRKRSITFTGAAVLVSLATALFGEAAPAQRPPAVAAPVDLTMPAAPETQAVASGQSAPAAKAKAKPKPAAAPSQDDPGYRLYKEAYAMVLREQWADARKAFRELAEKYPKSEYRDDAEYWMAYSWRDADADKAKKAYREFLRNYRSSPYFDDALADLDQMMARSMAVTVEGVPLAVGAPVPVPDAVSVFPGDSLLGITMRSLPPPAMAPMMRMRHVGRLTGTPNPFGLSGAGDEAGLDEATKLRLEALYAVERSGEDEKAFGALKAIAVDPAEKRVVRVAAMDALSGYRRHDPLQVYVSIAKQDTSEEMQLYAIESIGSAAPDREKAFDALVRLYDSVPASNIGKRKLVFYSIAEVGSDRSVDFLAGVARSGQEPELRREAVYYLGTIGGEKARAVLIDLLGGK